MATLRITQSGVDQTVRLDDVDITHALRGVTLKVEAGSLPVAELDAVLFDVDTVAEGAIIHVPDETRAALVALGWTPPEEG